MTISPIKIWELTPEQMAAYITGMDLGEPDKIVMPESFPKSGSSPEFYFGRSPNEIISKSDYLDLRKKGLTKSAIAAAYDLTPASISYRLKNWGLSDPAREREVLEAMQ